MRPTSGMWLATAMALVAAAVLVLEAAALTISTAPITFPAVTLDGTDKTVNGSTSAWRVNSDNRNGWNVTVASTDFTSGGGKTITVNNFEMRLLDANIVVVSGDGGKRKPVSTQTTFAPLSGTALKIVSARPNGGRGVYDLTPDFRLTVPAETYTGDYTATATIQINAGP